MLRRFMIIFVASILLISSIHLQDATANSMIKVIVDGKEIITDQPPIIVKGRTLIPLRAILEALHASVDYDQATQTVYANKGNTTITLKLGSKIATINNLNVVLDVPAQVINARTFVPVRFVSEALGEEIHYDSATKQVLITTSVDSATNVTVKDISDNGDGRDLQVRFNKAADESRISYYKIMVVKRDKAASFDLNKANAIAAANYTFVVRTGNNVSQTLHATSRDTDGALIKEDVAYSVFVVSISSSLKASQNSLSNASTPITLKSTSVPAVSNVRAIDIADYGDGRDMQVSFTKASEEKDISQYRVMVVREGDVDNFNVAAANNISATNYTAVTKTGNNITTTLSSSARDAAGNMIRSDIPYRVFVLSVETSASRKGNSLSQASASITLSHKLNVAAITNLKVNDVSDYGDGRDLEVSFNRISDESRLNHYRIMVVPSAEVNKFNLAEAKGLASANYTTVYKTGSNIRQVLHSTTKDVKGNTIQSNVAYRVFVLSVGDLSRGYGDTLSAVSSEIRLNINPGDIRGSNVIARDVADFGDGRDLQVSFSIPSNESRVAEYRIMVVRLGDVNNFNLNAANNVSSANYTTAWKTGAHQTINLPSSARDVSGNIIQNGVSYRVFVLSVGDRANSYVNSLSGASATINLSNNFTTVAATNVVASDIADFEDGRDIQVSFTKASNESNLVEYRIMVIKSAQASSFNAAVASAIPSNYYTSVAKTGSNITRALSSTARDIHGEVIRNGVSYRVFVLSVSSGGNASNNALSAASSTITLSKNLSSSPATNVTASDVNDNGDGRDLQVKFNKAAVESKVSQYRIMVVKSALANGFNLAEANAVHSNNYTTQAKTGSNITTILSSSARDTQGDLIRGGVAYKVFVLSVSSVGNTESNALSSPSSTITLSNQSVDAASNVGASDVGNNGNGLDLQVSFTKATNETPIAYYAIMVVPSVDANSFNLATANGVAPANYSTVAKTGSNVSTTLSAQARDVKGATIQNGTAYKVFVLSLADGINATTNGLSAASSEIVLANKSVTWSGTFNEVVNDGSIGTTVTSTVSGDTFASSLLEGVHFTVSHVPPGLTVNIVRTTANQATISLTGNATAHEPGNSIANLTISFTNVAFSSGNAAGISNISNSSLQVIFF